MPARARTKTEAASLLSERRKDEMLRECSEIFRAMTSTEASRNVARLKGVRIAPYMTPEDALAIYMDTKLTEAGFGK